MAALIKWLLRRRDQCTVTYSRFGVPGDAVEDHSEPTSIIVAAFNDNHPDFMFLKICHSQKAAVAATGFGMSFVILMFISAFFEFDWYHHKTGIDAIALLSLLFYLGFGVLIHYLVIVGIKRQASHYLLPFIVVYMMIIGSESIGAIYQLMHLHSSSISPLRQESRNMIIFSLLMIFLVVFVQANMLVAVIKCRLYLSRKEMHEVALKVAEKSRARNPAIRVVVASERCANSNGDVEQGNGPFLGNGSLPVHCGDNGTLQTNSNPRPPSYATATATTSACPDQEVIRSQAENAKSPLS